MSTSAAPAAPAAPADRGVAPLDHVTWPGYGVLCEAVLAAEERTAADRDLGLLPHIAARRHPKTRRLATLMESAARATIGYLTGRVSASSTRGDIARLADELGLPDELAGRREWAGAMEAVGRLVRDLALEELGLDVRIAPAPVGAGFPNLAWGWSPANPAQVRAVLADRVLQDILAEAAGDPLLRMDHRAGSWWFDGATAPLPDEPDRKVNVALAQSARRKEYCITGRLAPGRGTTIVESFLSSTPKGDPSPARREIARALAASHTSLWMVRARADERSVFEEVGSGARIHVTDHRPDTAYPPGGLAFGFVLPLEDGTYVRSPAMTFWAHDDPEAIEKAKRYFLQLAEKEGTCIAVELTLGAVTGHPAVSRHAPPAESPEEAQRLMDQASRLLRRSVGGREVKPPRDLVPEERAAVEAGTSELRRYMVDPAWHAWIEALDRQARG